MVRLPSPGGDENTWGDILNEFLTVEHNTNGTLKRTADVDKALTAIQSVNSKTGNTITLSASDVGAEAANAVSTHNAATGAHPDIRTLVADETTARTAADDNLQQQIDGVSISLPLQSLLNDHGLVRVTNDPSRHQGFNIGLFSKQSSPEIGMMYRDGVGHSMLQGGASKIMFTKSLDRGRSWSTPVQIRTETGTDYGGAVFTTTSSGRYIYVASRLQYISSVLTRIEPVCLISDDNGITWSESLISAASGMSFHSQLTQYQGSDFGSTSSWICYGQKDANSEKLWYLRTTNNGSSWTAAEIQNRVGGENSSEFTVAKLGSQDRWLMIGRNDDQSSTGNAYAWLSTNLINWSGPYNTGQRTGAAMSTLITDDNGLVYWFNPVRHINTSNLEKSNVFQWQVAHPDTIWANNAQGVAWTGWKYLASPAPGLLGYLKFLKDEGGLYAAFAADETDGTLLGANVYFLRPDWRRDDPYGDVAGLLGAKGQLLTRTDSALAALGAPVSNDLVLTSDDSASTGLAWKVNSGGGGGSGGSSVLSHISTSVAVSNTTTETTLLSFGVGGGQTAEGDVIRLFAWGTIANDSGASRTRNIRIKINGTTVVSGAATITAATGTKNWRLNINLLLGSSGNSMQAAHHLSSNVSTAGDWSGSSGDITSNAYASAISLDKSAGFTISVTTALAIASTSLTDTLLGAYVEHAAG